MYIDDLEQNNWGIGRKTQNEFFRGLLAPLGFGEHPQTHTFLESTCPEVNETHARARGVTMCACGCVDGRNVPYVHMHMEHQSKHACGRAR